MSIIVPAYFVASGVTLYAAIQSGVASLTRAGTRVYRAFSLSCLAATGFLFCSAEYYSAASIDGAAAWLRWQVAFGIVFWLPFFWFVALYTGQSRLKLWLAIVGLICAVLSVINFLSPYSARFISLN
ncbi:MAG TPA: hypothetical protein VI756_13065, partial [Blastocatellia bacterium]